MRCRGSRDTDEMEVRSFIGILFIIGNLRSSRTDLVQCYLTMSQKRFRFLLTFLRYDVIRSRMEREETEKLPAIRKIFQIFISNFQKNFITSKFLTIDEQLLASRGRCAFKQYISSKPTKYGLKVFALVDVQKGYTFNLEIYAGI